MTSIGLKERVRENAREYCEWETFNPSCAEDEVVVITRAKYGRMVLGRCVKKDYGHIGCETDVTSELDRECSGRRACKKPIISLHNKRSCPTDFKSYLEAGYECVKVAVPSVGCSGPRTAPALLDAPSGTIASLVARNLSCPLRIQVEDYQRIHVTLIDFTVPRGSDPWFDTPHVINTPSAHTNCQPYAILTEVRPDGITSVNSSICGSARRETSVYTSSGSILDVHVTSYQEEKHFLIKYEALGCKPLLAPADARVETDGDHATVQCNSTDEAWHLTCRGTGWIGSIGNCSNVAHGGTEDDWEMGGLRVSDFPFGILIVVALGVAIGVAIGVVMLVGVLTYMRRRRRRKVRSRSNYILKPVSDDINDLNKSTCSECHTDCTPMLIKRSSVDECSLTASTPCSRRQYACSWPRNRPLPVPSSAMRPSEVDLNDLEADGGLLSSELHTPGSPPPGSEFRTLPMRDTQNAPVVCPQGTIYNMAPRQDSGLIPSVFTTFKPVRSANEAASTSNGQCPNVYFVEGGRRPQDNITPYYFKFDAPQGGCPHDPSHRPDVVQGCALCQASMSSIPET
ncbi:hypothetical protein CAPTEDRAFT_207346 [Capitella teleta]|uniref:SUEL-type lectin domain-containing protein n=1 Tax=Capitella teleta TaxID=283909 RepID=R7UDS8_CAPTE|nr:hypothetical protein CAPTEDRAFT_207346 [Capitella teleta]|eukprot:ELU04550.1 hypothetical protein CAPTEDRAFT_207346 [Capitella teleta]